MRGLSSKSSAGEGGARGGLGMGKLRKEDGGGFVRRAASLAPDERGAGAGAGAGALIGYVKILED